MMYRETNYMTQLNYVFTSGSKDFLKADDNDRRFWVEPSHRIECTGHHCTRCGACLFLDPTDKDVQELCDETAEQLAVCIDCRTPEELVG